MAVKSWGQVVGELGRAQRGQSPRLPFSEIEAPLRDALLELCPPQKKNGIRSARAIPGWHGAAPRPLPETPRRGSAPWRPSSQAVMHGGRYHRKQVFRAPEREVDVKYLMAAERQPK